MTPVATSVPVAHVSTARGVAGTEPSPAAVTPAVPRLDPMREARQGPGVSTPTMSSG